MRPCNVSPPLNSRKSVHLWNFQIFMWFSVEKLYEFREFRERQRVSLLNKKKFSPLIQQCWLHSQHIPRVNRFLISWRGWIPADLGGHVSQGGKIKSWPQYRFQRLRGGNKCGHLLHRNVPVSITRNIIFFHIIDPVGLRQISWIFHISNESTKAQAVTQTGAQRGKCGNK